MPRSRPLAASFWAALLLVVATPAAPSSAGPAPGAAPVATLASATDPVQRWAGPDRYAVSAAVSAASYAPGVPVAYVASGRVFADALSAAPVATSTGGPVLLTEPAALPAPIRTELARLKPARIVVLGGTASVSPAVASALTAYTSGAVQRVAGRDRYAVSAALSAASYSPGVPVAYVASGQGFADALSGAPVAGRTGGPVLLTDPTLPAVVRTELARLKPARIVVLGGTASVSAGVASRLAGYTSGAVERWAGADRFAVSATVSAKSFASGVPVAYVASGLGFADALSVAPVAGATGGPVLLTGPSTLPSTIRAELTRLKPTRVVVLGGTGSVGSGVETALRAPFLPASCTTAQVWNALAACGWPGPGSAGVPSGQTFARTVTSGLTVTADNTVIDGWDVRGGIQVRARNVVIRNSRVTSSFGGASGSGVVNINPGASATIERSTLNGSNATHACVWHEGSAMTVTAVDCSGVNDGIFMWATTEGRDGNGDNFLIQDSWLHGFTTSAANGHVDGIQTEGAKHGVIRHNTVDVAQDQTSAIAIWNGRKNVDDIVVDGNLIQGGGFSVYAEDYSPSEANPAGGYSVRNVSFTNNVFSTSRYGCVGYWGVWFTRGAPTDGWRRTANRVLETGQALDGGNPTYRGTVCS